MSIEDKQLESIFRLKRQNLDKDSIVDDSPISMLGSWLDDAIGCGLEEANSMVLSTVDSQGNPSSRVVLLKQIRPEGLIFFSNYTSRKAHELSVNPRVAVNIHWPELHRQIRVEGLTVKGDASISDDYFNSRPHGSKIGAWASPQSKMIPNREFLENRYRELEEQYKNKEIARPEHWGAYLIQPSKIEFWKGREDRLHDRIEFYLVAGVWKHRRLAP